jgi:membrane complex biogenesis BtpA family protein
VDPRPVRDHRPGDGRDATEDLMFSSPKPVIAVVHAGALPGTPAGSASLRELERVVRAESTLYRDGGVHGIMLENMHDVPYLRGGVGPEITAAMTVLAQAMKDASGLPCGIQILAGANTEAVAVAHAAGLDFVRAEGFAFAHVADEGIIQSSAAELLRFRRHIGADRVQVWADVKKKHSSHAITADVGIGETAHAAEFMRADGVIVTGASTGVQPAEDDIREVRQHCKLPLYLGSGITPENLPRYCSLADGFIIGSTFKQDGIWNQPVDARRVEQLMSAHARCTG